jgi:superkiller protein 3
VVFWVGCTVFFVAVALGLVQSVRFDQQLPRLYFGYEFYVDEFFKSHDYGRAAEQLELALVIAGTGDHNLHNNLGIALERSDRLDQAIVRYRAALASKPDFAEAHLNLGMALRAHGEPTEDTKAGVSEAEYHLRQATLLDPGGARAHSELARSLLARRRVEEALGHLRQAVEIAPEDVDARYLLGSTLAGAGQPDEAVGHLLKVIEAAPEYEQAYYYLGAAFLAQQQHERAVEALRRALLVNPDYMAAHNSLGALLTSQQKADEGAKHLQKAIEIDPGYAPAHYNLGRALGALGKLDEAIREFREALRLVPDYPAAHDNLGIALALKQEIGEAIRHFREAIRLNPEYTPAHFNLARALRDVAARHAAAGQFDQAVTALEEALGSARKARAGEIADDIAAELAEYKRGKP